MDVDRNLVILKPKDGFTERFGKYISNEEVNRHYISITRALVLWNQHVIDRNIYPKIEIQGQQKQTHAGIGTTIDCR